MNYQKELENILSDISKDGKRTRLLLHSCCAPCSSYCLTYLMEFFDITVFYYNPNIYPKEEFDKRADEQIKLIEALNLNDRCTYRHGEEDIVRIRKYDIDLVIGEYDHISFLKKTAGFEDEKEGGKRCNECFKLRLEASYNYAKDNGFDYFGTTLSVSPHKNAMLINEIGKDFDDISKRPAYLISDFKKKDGYKTSIELSKKFDLYRQSYCGCEFSLNNS